MYKTIATSVSIFAISLLMGATSVFADGTCTNQYGTTVPCQEKDLFINKEVQNPIDGAFVDNILIKRFSIGSNVIYRMIISNTSGETRNDVQIEDRLPINLDYVDSDPTGTWDKTLRIFRLNLGSIPAGEKRTVFMWTKVVGTINPTDPCPKNWVNVYAPARPDADTSESTICLTDKVLGTTTLPTAGVNDLVMMIPLLTMAGTGLALMRKK
jgi:uncharacterized repeat protein (TIGR01451 family)